MCRPSLKHVILYSVVCMWTAGSLNLFASDLFGAPDVYSAEAELEFDQDDLEEKGLPVSLETCTKASISFRENADQFVLTSELLSVSRWHLRGPPIS
jgi:hypothetical protein